MSASESSQEENFDSPGCDERTTVDLDMVREMMVRSICDRIIMMSLRNRGCHQTLLILTMSVRLLLAAGE